MGIGHRVLQALSAHWGRVGEQEHFFKKIESLPLIGVHVRLSPLKNFFQNGGCDTLLPPGMSRPHVD